MGENTSERMKGIIQNQVTQLDTIKDMMTKTYFN
jgi:hypothetical protein